jgi:hypothetical protein
MRAWIIKKKKRNIYNCCGMEDKRNERERKGKRQKNVKNIYRNCIKREKENWMKYKVMDEKQRRKNI